MQRKLPWFLQSAPSMACAKGGAGAYTDAIQVDPADDTGVAGLSRGVVAASSFRTSYVPLSSQDDFISALRVCCFDCLRVERSFCCVNVCETLHCDCIRDVLTAARWGRILATPVNWCATATRIVGVAHQ